MLESVPFSESEQPTILSRMDGFTSKPFLKIVYASDRVVDPQNDGQTGGLLGFSVQEWAKKELEGAIGDQNPTNSVQRLDVVDLEYPDSVAVVTDHPAQVELYPDGSFIKVKRAPQYHTQSAAKPKMSHRSAIAGFSRKSQTRLTQTLAKVNRSALPVLITLTYPGEFPIDPLVWKRDRKTLCDRFIRRFPHTGFIWKLEPQKRGAPHFHLLVWDTVLTPWQLYANIRDWIKTAWFEVVGSRDDRHLHSGTRVEVARSFGAIAKYACKYVAKMVAENAAWGDPGRWWGKHNVKAIPFAEELIVWLETGEASDLIRWIDRFRQRDHNRLRRRDTTSRWAMVENPKRWLENLDRQQAIKVSVDPLTLSLENRFLAKNGGICDREKQIGY